MRSSHQLFSLVFLASLLCVSVGSEYSTRPSDIFRGVKYALLHGEDERNENQTSPPLIPGDDIISQIISLLNCGPFPFSPNSHLQYSLDYNTRNLRLFQECDRYFKATPKNKSFQVQCKYKKWIFNEIGCKKTVCPRLTAPPGGHISTNDNTFNTTVYFWCSRGFSIKGSDKLFCEESGQWNLPTPTCDVSYCRPLPSPRDGFVSSQRETATNQTIEFTCKIGYFLIGDSFLRCLADGRWNTTAPVCKKLCIVPNITNQSEAIRSIPELKELSVGSLLYQGQRVIFSCKPSYTMLQSGLSTCIGGTWRPPIRCRKTCAVTEIANGGYILSKDAKTIEYYCQSEYQLVGQRKLSCTSEVTWDSEPPICTKLCTFPEQNNVLSFRQKGTYEIVPFGTKITNGTQLHPICRSGTPRQNHTSNTTECINGELNPYPCSDQRSRLESGFLKILFGTKWYYICETSNDVCDAFGYKRYRHARCLPCYELYLDNYLKTSKISLGRKRTRKHCIQCV